jgi:chromosome segregation ATPase
MLIQEVILENFMSYEYARVPFKQGVNIIGGPNGAGKSSLLLAISVGLGQTYTERSRKLSDLIRWGKDQARVTLILDNSKQSSKRPVSNTAKISFSSPECLGGTGNTFLSLKTAWPASRTLNVCWASSAWTPTTC